MPTLFDGTPGLVERILGSDLIAIGTVMGLREILPAEGFEVPRVSGLFEVELEDVLRGDRPPGRILVRVIGDGTDERAVWAVPMEERKRVLLLLARDVAPELPEGVFAPYFQSSFPVEDGFVRVAEDAVDELTGEIAGVERDVVPLDGLRRLIDLIGAQREERLRELVALVPEEVREQPYPEVLERPAIEEGRPLLPETPVEPSPEGGQPATLRPNR